RQGAPPFARPAALAGQARADDAADGPRIERSELLLADRPSRREELSFLRRAAESRQALLRGACRARLYPAEELERGVIGRQGRYRAPPPPRPSPVQGEGVTCCCSTQFSPSPLAGEGRGGGCQAPALPPRALSRQPPHRAVEAFESQPEHATFHELAHHVDRGRAAPIALRHGVEPD